MYRSRERCSLAPVPRSTITTVDAHYQGLWSQLGGDYVRNLKLVVGVGLVLSVAGCASPIYTESIDGVPEDLGTLGAFDESFRVAWDDSGDLLFVTFGSSSCPNEPSAVSVESPTHLVIEVSRAGGALCTADVSAKTYTIPFPEGLSVTEEIIVEPGDGTTIRLPPAMG